MNINGNDATRDSITDEAALTGGLAEIIMRIAIVGRHYRTMPNHSGVRNIIRCLRLAGERAMRLFVSTGWEAVTTLGAFILISKDAVTSTLS